jgi:flavorubredoxin
LKPLKENLAGGGIEVAFDDLEVKYVPKQADLDRCWEYGVKIARKVKGLA